MIWDHRCLRRLDFRSLFLVIALMCVSLVVISSTTGFTEIDIESFLTPLSKVQLRSFLIGACAYIFFSGLDYHQLKKWAWVLYFFMLLMLIGLFFVSPIQNVHRWYRIPLINFAFQPSEYAKLITVIALSRFLEQRTELLRQGKGSFVAILIVLIPFILILKQPDLGTALVLYPITLAIFYLGNVNQRIIKIMSVVAIAGLSFVVLMFLGVISHEKMRPLAMHVLKEYQYERLNPLTYHQKAAQTAIALGGITGNGFRHSEFTGGGWLPAPHTDSVFAAFSEDFGIVGVFLLLLFFFSLVYCSFQVTAVAKDRFGRMLAAGIAVYLAMHVVVNIGMMCGFFPITGVPLILVTYGGSSVLSTMTALGILQSIYSRRFLF